MNTIKTLILASIISVAAHAGFAQDVPDPDPARYSDTVKSFVFYDAGNTLPKNPVLFVGSSSIRMWKSGDDFPGFVILNRGFGGSQWSDLNHFFDQLVAPYDAPTIVVYEGDNDITVGKSPEQVLEDTKEFVEKVKGLKKQPNLIFLAIKPSITRANIWPNMARYNELLKEYVETLPNAWYVDEAAKFFTEDGSLPADLFSDGLHLSEKGYNIWIEALTPLLQEVHPKCEK